MCVLSIKGPIRKRSGNLFNDPRIYIYIYRERERERVTTTDKYVLARYQDFIINK